ncbi:hypothetical protein DFJ63DRAFT_310435 [Scheffersomyces coipomensis]|uniref:uncharacterized protein n=1 Tax=Scheffersomyces coipomensis TaxID=1788519 RepID=UPI00315D6A08
MQAFEDQDLIIYLLISAYIILKDFGFNALLQFSILHGYFLFWQIPYFYLCNRFLLPYPYHSVYSQRATDFEYLIVEMLKYFYKYLQHDEIGKIFFEDQIFRILNKFRYIRELGEGLGDIRFHDLQDLEIGRKDIKGLFFYSQSRVQASKHDILILYVHGGVGFGDGLESYPAQMSHLLNCYQYLSGLADDKCHIIVMGDSTGATLALSLLLNISKPSPYLINHIRSLNMYNTQEKQQEQIQSLNSLRKPSYSILISPVTNVGKYSNIKDNDDDYLCENSLSNWSQVFATPTILEQESNEYISPGQCRDLETWKLALPKYGIYISYGSEEAITEDIEDFVELMKQTGCKLKIDKQFAQIHNWAILSFYGEELIDHREYSIQTYAGVLSRMLLWNTDTFFSSDANPILNVVTIDDDYV